MRCEARLSRDYMRARRGIESDGIYRRVADYETGGDFLCTEHASLRALTRCLERGMAVRIARKIGETEYRSSSTSAVTEETGR